MVGLLRIRLFVALLVPVVLTGCLACLASFNALQGSYRTLLGDRLAEIADNLANVAEDTERLGQTLAVQSGLQRLIEQAKVQNKDVSEVSVILEDGRVVFDTDLAAVGQRVPTTWLPRAQLGISSWAHADGDNLIAGCPVMNSFRRPLGAVIVRVSGTLLAVRKVSMFRAVALVGLVFLGLSVATCYVAALQLARCLVPQVRRATADIDQAAQLMRCEVAALPDEAEVVARVRVLVQPLNEAERTFTRLDEAA